MSCRCLLTAAFPLRNQKSFDRTCVILKEKDLMESCIYLLAGFAQQGEQMLNVWSSDIAGLNSMCIWVGGLWLWTCVRGPAAWFAKCFALENDKCIRVCAFVINYPCTCTGELEQGWAFETKPRMHVYLHRGTWSFISSRPFTAIQKLLIPNPL